MLEFLDYYGVEKYKDYIVNKDLPFSKYLLENNNAGMIPFVKSDKLYNVLYFPVYIDKQENLDCILIHELLHVLDEHIIEFSVDTIRTRGAFETMTLKGESKEDERRYEYISEIIHQKVAEEVTKLLHDKGFHIFNDKMDKYIENYSNGQCVVIDEFYNRYKDKILKLKLTGNIDEFWSFIGMEQFEKFNDWCIAFYNKFNTPDIRRKVNENPNEEERNFLDIGFNIINSFENYDKNR